MIFYRSSLWRLAFLGAILMWAALPPADLWLLAWIAPIPWIMLIRREELGGRRPYAVLFLAGFVFWLGALHWLRLPHPATSIGWIALSFYFAFYVPAFVALSRAAIHRLRVPAILAAPVVWTGLELARAHLLTGMTMGSLGHTQYRWVELIQVSDWAGFYGVGFVVMCVAATLARMLPCNGCRMVLWPIAPAAAVLGGALLYGYFRTAGETTSPGPQIALIQGSIDVAMPKGTDRESIEREVQANRDRTYREYLGLSREVRQTNPSLDLVVWPESMFPEPMLTVAPGASRPPDFGGAEAEFQSLVQETVALEASGMARSLMADTARSLGVPLLLGLDRYHFDSDQTRVFCSAAYVAPDGRLLGRYDKNHLVLFGEYVPLADRFPWLQRFTPLPVSATPGDRSAAFDLSWGGATWSTAAPGRENKGSTAAPDRDIRTCRIAPNICYESVLPHVIRRQVNRLAAEGREPDILVNLTNDGWFWGSSELDMHLACGVFRAVECRKPFLIAANTGFSAWIDGDGRIVERGPRRAKGVIVADVRLDRRRSWYLTHGDWFAGACLALCVLFGAIGFFLNADRFEAL